MDGTRRSDIKPGSRVLVVQKQDQDTGQLTEGTVEAILTKSATHPHGIKVRLADGKVGRVKAVVGQYIYSFEPENSKRGVFHALDCVFGQPIQVSST